MGVSLHVHWCAHTAQQLTLPGSSVFTCHGDRRIPHHTPGLLCPSSLCGAQLWWVTLCVVVCLPLQNCLPQRVRDLGLPFRCSGTVPSSCQVSMWRKCPWRKVSCPCGSLFTTPSQNQQEPRFFESERYKWVCPALWVPGDRMEVSWAICPPYNGPSLISLKGVGAGPYSDWDLFDVVILHAIQSLVCHKNTANPHRSHFTSVETTNFYVDYVRGEASGCSGSVVRPWRQCSAVTGENGRMLYLIPGPERAIKSKSYSAALNKTDKLWTCDKRKRLELGSMWQWPENIWGVGK